MDLLVGEGLQKRLGEKTVIGNVSIGIREGIRTAFAGATGSGKSSLMKMLAGLIEPDHGKVYFEGERVEGPLTKLIPGHDKIAYLSQYFELRNHYRVEEIFEYSNRLQESEAFQILGLCDVVHLLHRRSDQLSGGEKQRIALARVLITKPRVLLLDEPFSNLDLQHKRELKSAITNVTANIAITPILVSHDAGDILPWADVIHVMREGQIVQSGSPQQIYYQPKDAYVAGLFGYYNLVDEPLRKSFDAHSVSIPDNVSFLRPEMIALNAPGTGTLTGIIKSTLFLGSFWQGEIMFEGHTLFCHFYGNSFYPGNKVSISLNFPPLFQRK